MCAAQRGKEFLYKRDSQGKLVTRQSRLADPNHGTAIKSFRKAEDQKSKLPHKLWGKKRVETLVMLSSIDYRVLQPLEFNVARSCSVISLPHINHLLAMST